MHLRKWTITGAGEWLRGNVAASEELLHRVAARIRGETKIVDNNREILALWNEDKTNAAIDALGNMLLRKDARKIEVLEEFLHLKQEKIAALNARFRVAVWENYPVYELAVKNFMIRHAKILGISKNDVQILRKMMHRQMESKVDMRGQPLVLPKTGFE
jgi:hypothetical protein